MNTTDRNILKLIDLLKEKGMITYNTEFCDAIGMRKQNLRNVTTGRNHFTPEHIEQIVKKFKVNANWIFGASEDIFMHTGMNTNAHTKQAQLEH